MSAQESSSKTPLLVEFSIGPGVRQVARTKKDIPGLAKKTRKALDEAMAGINDMAERVAQTVEKMTKSPSEIEVSFGIKFDAETGVLIAKAGLEASINVTLKWQKRNAEKK